MTLPGQMELTPTDIAGAMTNEQLVRQSLLSAFSAVMPKTEGKQYLLTSKRNNAQMELATVINHQQLIHDLENGSAIPFLRAHEDAHKPLGVRLAKMLGQYEARPSSELWSGIQALAREILK